jgi:large subunit ribosomal protein L5e
VINMPFVKVVKNKAYFKRFQVSYKRRREGKTDFRARRQMVLQDKTKFDAPKYRLVARVTGSDIVAQIVHAKAGGDHVVTAAYSHELPAFGMSVGLTNYAAAYATGLLVARRLLTKLGIAEKFPGAKEATGEFKPVRVKGGDEEGDAAFPFKAILDIGLARTTTGARIFGVLKGAVDGGVAVPHKATRFPGFNKTKKELDAKAHRARIMGAHVADYLKKTIAHNAENPDEKTTQFSKFIKAGIKPADVEGLYKKLHAAIRAAPTKTLEKKKKADKGPRKAFNQKRLTHKERTAAAQKKIATLRAQLKK